MRYCPCCGEKLETKDLNWFISGMDTEDTRVVCPKCLQSFILENKPFFDELEEKQKGVKNVKD